MSREVIQRVGIPVPTAKNESQARSSCFLINRRTACEYICWINLDSKSRFSHHQQHRMNLDDGLRSNRYSSFQLFKTVLKHVDRCFIVCVLDAFDQMFSQIITQ